ncbi:hypothetical protein [Pseudomonas baltica]|uniref:hypothetical protein n=1 Tax=Pseudomonas baltica TaxID=2762576 RepID=UPI00289ED277|nr:hypothetical protein [Pseudomonas baltica]
MSIINKISEALTILNTVVAFAEKVKAIFGVTDSDDLTAKLAGAEAVLTATQEALDAVAPAVQ